MIKKLRTTAGGGRFKTGINYKAILTTTSPYKKLAVGKRATGGRSGGTVTVRGRSSGHKKLFRSIDFRRDKFDITGIVATVEYDPNRRSFISLIVYPDGDKRYILAPEGVKVGHKISAGNKVEVRDGNAMPLKNIPIGTSVHNVELKKGKGGQIIRSAGAYAIIQGREVGFVILKLPSGEIRRVPEQNLATIGAVSNIEWKNITFGKAGRKRNMGRKPHNRGVAMSPRDHPHGGGEGRSGIGMSSPKTRWGKKAFGKTRNRGKKSNMYIIQGRKRGGH